VVHDGLLSVTEEVGSARRPSVTVVGGLIEPLQPTH